MCVCVCAQAHAEVCRDSRLCRNLCRPQFLHARGYVEANSCAHGLVLRSLFVQGFTLRSIFVCSRLGAVPILCARVSANVHLCVQGLILRFTFVYRGLC